MTTELAVGANSDSSLEAASDRPVVTVYTTGSACMQCKLTEALLSEFGLPFVECDLTREENQAARDYVTGELGYTRAPVVVVDEHDHWSGFQPDQVKRLAWRGSGEQ